MLYKYNVFMYINIVDMHIFLHFTINIILIFFFALFALQTVLSRAHTSLPCTYIGIWHT